MSKETPEDAPIPSISDDAVTLREDAITIREVESGDDEPTRMKVGEYQVKDVGAKAAERNALQAFVGRVISDRYVIHELIGSGGMGAVYRGEQVHLRKPCAIKILLPEAAKQQDLVLRFEREAIAGAHVDHPNVVGASDFGKLPDGSCFLVLDYVKGTPLEDVIYKGPMPVERALVLARQIALALAAVHEKGIVHRDIKPRNILLDTNEQVKLLDFGLAKVKPELLSSESRNAKPVAALTGAGMVMGTLAYLAPEAMKGMDGVDARSDLYALGIVMYEMFSGKRPIDEKDAVLHFKRLRTEAAPSIRERAPEVNVPAPVEALVAKLLEREPAARYASANDLVAAIDAISEELKKAPAKAEGAKEAPAQAAEKPAEKPAEKVSDEKPAEKASGEGPKKETAPALANVATAIKAQLKKKPVVLAAAGALVLGVIIVLVIALGGSGESKKPAPVASSAPARSAEPEEAITLPLEVDGVDAAGWRERMKKASLKKDWIQASRALLALAKLDPALVTGNELRGEVVAVVAGIGFETSVAESDQVFEALTHDLGSGGLDVLFSIVRTRGGSKAANRANEILSRTDVLPRMSPALRIALDLRRAACQDKHHFFARAVDEGDGRALDELVIAQQARCPSPKDPCCYRENPEIKDAIAKLKAKFQR